MAEETYPSHTHALQRTKGSIRNLDASFLLVRDSPRRSIAVLLKRSGLISGPRMERRMTKQTTRHQLVLGSTSTLLFFFLSRTIRMNPKDEVYSDFFTKIMNQEYPFPPSFILHKFGFITELYFWDLTQQHCIVYLGNNYFFFRKDKNNYHV